MYISARQRLLLSYCTNGNFWALKGGSRLFLTMGKANDHINRHGYLTGFGSEGSVLFGKTVPVGCQLLSKQYQELNSFHTNL
jgi:hypothetical protein